MTADINLRLEESLSEAETDPPEEQLSEDVVESEEASHDSSAEAEKKDETKSSGKRERKTVERLSFASTSTPRTKIAPMGSGDALASIEFIDHTISSKKAVDLVPLHKLIYKARGKTSEVKHNLKIFNGFDFKKDDDAYKVFLARCKKLRNKDIKYLLGLLGLPLSGSHDSIAERLAEFLVNPISFKKSIPRKKKRDVRKRTKSVEKGISKTTKTTKSRKTFSKKTEDKSDESSEDDETDSSDDDGNEETDNSSHERDSDEHDDKTSEELSTRKKIAVPKAAKKDHEEESKESSAGVKRKASAEDYDSDDEPLMKKMKPAEPSDEELRTFIRKYMAKVNLEEVTMKTVYKKVTEKYPQTDLSSRKDYIKETVKSLLG